MTITAIDHDGFNSGTRHSATNASVGVVVDNDGVGEHPTGYIADPPGESKEGQFSFTLNNIGGLLRSLTHTIGTDWITIGFPYWFQEFEAGVTHFFMGDHSVAPNLRFAVKDGDLLIYNASSTIIKTVSGALTALRWYDFNVKYKRHSSADIIVTLNNAEVYNATGVNLSNAGGATLEVQWKNTTNPATTIKHYIGEYWILADDGANIDSDRTMGRHVIVDFSTGSGGIISDFTGNHTSILGGPTYAYANLETGKTFANALESVAPEGINFAESRGTIGKAHGVSMDLSASGGPLGSITKGALLAVKFTWSFKSESNPTKFGSSIFDGLYGGDASASTDGMTEFSKFGTTMSTTRKDQTVYLDISETYCPQESEFLQQGFWINNAFGSPESGFVYGMWASCLYRPKRRVMIGGKLAEAD